MAGVLPDSRRVVRPGRESHRDAFGKVLSVTPSRPARGETSMLSTGDWEQQTYD